MHRREGDTSNSKHWWRNTGDHPAFEAVGSAVVATLDTVQDDAAQAFTTELRAAGKWLPVRFVELCEVAKQTGIEETWLRQVQVAEIAALLEWCHNSAT